MVPTLSTGVLQKILSGNHVDNPVVQLLGYKKIPGSADRFRLSVSDGVHSYNVAMLATQLNSRLISGDFEKNTIVRLDRYAVNQVQPDKKVMILLELTVLQRADTGVERIGNPQNLEAKGGGAGSGTNANATPIQSDRSSGVEQKYNPSAFQSTSNGMDLGGQSSANMNVHPINTLTPYQNRWTIRARVTNKAPIKTWSNSRGEGKLFSMDLLDESGEIRATAFNDQCDKFYESIDVNRVYFISKAHLKTANKAFSTLKNDYEMSFTADTTVIPCNDDSKDIPMLQFDFTPISQIQNVDKDGVIDVIGICKTASDLQQFTSRNNKELKKKDITLLDSSCMEINLTLWSAEAEKFDGSMNPVVAIKGARVSDFGGRSLSSLNSSVLQLNPDIREAHMLRGWYDREGANATTQSITVKGGGSGGMNTNWKTFAQAKAENLGLGEKPDYYSAKATVIMVKRDSCLYQACPQEDCNKKVVDMNNGLYRCEKCSQEFNNFKWRLLLSINIADFSDSQWVTCFQESAETILGTTAQELGNMKDMNEDKYNEVINTTNFKSFIFRLRVKMDNFNDESRLKTVVFSATPLNSVDYAKKLLTDIKNLESVL